MTRRAFTLIEILAAGAVLAILLIVTVRMLDSVAAQHRALADRRTAAEEADNVMERLFARPWSELTDERVRDIALSDAIRQSVPTGKLEVNVTESPDQPAARKIAVVIRWQQGTGQSDRSVRLVAWRYEREAKPGRQGEPGKGKSKIRSSKSETTIGEIRNQKSETPKTKAPMPKS